MDIALPTVTQEAQVDLNTEFGVFDFRVFQDEHGLEYITLISGELDPSKEVLVRVHGECATGEVFHSLRCDCRGQLDRALKRISVSGNGLVVYLPQEGRGIGLTNKIRAYNLQVNEGLDTVDANEALGLPADNREYDIAASILYKLNIKTIRLLTNNPKKVNALAAYGFDVTREPHEISPTERTRDYLKTKKDRLGHLLTQV